MDKPPIKEVESDVRVLLQDLGKLYTIDWDLMQEYEDTNDWKSGFIYLKKICFGSEATLKSKTNSIRQLFNMLRYSK